MKKTKYFGVFIAFIMVVTSLLQGMGNAVHAQGVGKQVDAEITKFKILNYEKKETDRIFITDSFYLNVDWDASKNGANLHEGDYFDITLPEKMKFPTDSAAVDFNIYGPDGKTVIGKAHVTPNSNGGGKVRITFTNWVENKYNVKGSMFLSAKFDTERVDKDTKNTFKIKVNSNISGDSKSKDADIIIDGLKNLKDEYLSKWGVSIDNEPNQVRWEGRINHIGTTLTNVVISDTLGASGETYIPGSFKLRRVQFDPKGNIIKVIENVDVTGKLTISADKKSFTLNLGNLNGEQFDFQYKTTYKPNSILKNSLKIQSTEKTETKEATFISSSSGGNGEGDLTNKIKIIKVDSENNETKLAGAEFEVIRISDGQKFTLKTDNNGETVSDKLLAGDYKIKEIKPPAGYEISKDELTVSVADGQAVIKTISNNPIKTSVEVSKKWIGKEVTSVTIHLYGDDKDTGKTLILNKENNWKGTFDNLRKFNKEGKEIKYTVKEDVPNNYEEKISGTAKDGFTITNINREKVEIPVLKKWVGKEKESVDVKLLADGKDTGKTVKLEASSQWKGKFDNLLKYDEKDGHEIVYTVEEVKVQGYKSVISGTAKDGFVITNTIVGKVSIPVTKVWIGKQGDHANISLMADGVKVDSVVLNKDNNWQYTFVNLEKYKDGKEIKYTIIEEKMKGYDSEITGEAGSGFIVKNTNNEKIDIPVLKKWIGGEEDSIIVNLYANGEKIDSKKISKKDNWKYTFKNLDKYRENKEVIYTVKEEKVQGYNTEITGDNKGFIITNKKYEPKIPKKPNTPKTGDNRDVLVDIGMFMSLGVIIAMTTRKTRKHK